MVSFSRTLLHRLSKNVLGHYLVFINDCSDTWTLKMFLAKFGVLKAVLMKI